jgi:hypothetical protein
MVTEQGSVPLHPAPVQPLKVKGALSGVARSVITVPLG